jgi:phosphate transport system ATP-binding protein
MIEAEDSSVVRAPVFTLGKMQRAAPCCVPTPRMRVAEVAVRYGTRTVLDQVTLDIHRGCITALIGPSGCGKTSFLSALNRLTDLVPGAQVAGKVFLDEQDIFDPKIDVMALRRRIGMIFQRPNPFPLSVRRNLELPLKEHGVRGKTELADKIETTLRAVGLWDEVGERLDAPAMALSGGQQQRLCIARALVLEPEVLLMDEPCSSLDPISSSVVEELILELRERYTVVIVTHNLAQARRIANYAAFFWVRERIGKLIEFDHCQQLFDAPRHELTAAYVSGARG